MMQALKHVFKVPRYLMIDDYLRNWVLRYDSTEGRRERTFTTEAAQGSILGPDLWNVAYDDLIRTEITEETLLVGYVDDVAAVIVARDVEMVLLKLNEAMRTINGWMTDHGLSLVLRKTEIVILTKKRMNAILPLRVREETVVTKPAAKYLGVMIDC